MLGSKVIMALLASPQPLHTNTCFPSVSFPAHPASLYPQLCLFSVCFLVNCFYPCHDSCVPGPTHCLGTQEPGHFSGHPAGTLIAPLTVDEPAWRGAQSSERQRRSSLTRTPITTLPFFSGQLETKGRLPQEAERLGELATTSPFF